MPQPEKSFIRKSVESLALKLFLFIASLAGAAVLAWYTANSAWLHGVPGYKLGLIIAALFALCGIGTYFVILSVARIPLRNAPAGSFLEPHESWLRDIAEGDRLDLYKAVYVIGCRVQESLTNDNPHVVFHFHIRNGTVFAITIDPDIKGFISLRDRRLTGERISSTLPHNLQHGWGDLFEIRQELSAHDVAEINEMDAAAKDQGFYDFGNLHITIKGTCPTADALPARLQFKNVLRRRTDNGIAWV